MLYEKMRLKKTGETARVYDITDGVSTIFDPSLYQRQNMESEANQNEEIY